MQKWSTEAWEASETIYNEILRLPFLLEMADGSLSHERFIHYIKQDNLYIDDYSRVLAHIASRLESLDDVASFLEFANDGVAMEKGLHSMYVSQAAPAKTDACLMYTSLLKAQATENVAVEAAAILPCFWVYQQVGVHILSIAKLEGNPYADWIKCYGDPAFAASNARAIAICDALAEAASPQVRQRMTAIFREACRMEWLFWHSAYLLGNIYSTPIPE